ncbi:MULTISPECIES: NtaA/DmoA family FMN-dependent monooxygenase [Novosphingobium]|uniref:NtaA/DmoA family FMN-dependent monooxygenase n=1 Tax=Novosphingobium sp. ST904 TaxID=1684385 RepID=UPI001048DE07|nr:NtaA/DmoA family FMN-dependent monooxygenase [Novosphingobium sp. ST904]TCM30771.1 FMN-dependent oxidoreductase (nitrilotriacetate monooxygenase family) [Novosphingobium sp. ST904]
MARDKLKFGAVLIGVGDASGKELWRDPAVPLDASVDIDWYIRQAREAEDARFDFVFIVDSQYITPDFPNHHLNRLEPLTLLSAVATATQRIGLVATISTTYSEPFDIARRLASLDLISKGRAGWNIVTSQDPGTAGNFSRTGHGDYETRYRRASEAVEVVQGLWQSYEEGAFAQDRTAARFLDPARQHRLDHRGEFFSVSGPLNIQRSRQGQPPLVQAGTSPQGRELSAQVADIVFSFARNQAEALELATDVRARARRYGRAPESLLFIPALSVTIADTDEAARRKFEARQTAGDLRAQLASLSRQFAGHDFSGYDLDAPFPEIASGGEAAGIRRFHEDLEAARREGRTLRQVLADAGSAWLRLAGSPVTIADEIERWHASGAADGFNVFVQHPDDWARFRAEVVPILAARGLFRDDYSADTLRGNLGLEIAPSRHSAEHRTLEKGAAVDFATQVINS